MAPSRQESIPGEIRRQGLERRGRHGIVDLVLVAAVGAVPRHFGDFGLQRQDAVGAGLGIAHPRQRHHVGEIFAIGLAGLHDRLVVGQIIVAVGHAQAGLAEIDGIVVGILVVHADADIVDAHGGKPDRAHGMGDIVQGLQAGQIIQILLHRRKAARFDGGGVDEGVIKIAQLALFRRSGAAPGFFSRSATMVLQPLLAQNLQILEGAGLGAVGRNDGGLQPACRSHAGRNCRPA